MKLPLIVFVATFVALAASQINKDNRPTLANYTGATDDLHPGFAQLYARQGQWNPINRIWNLCKCKGDRFLAAMVVDDQEAAKIMTQGEAMTFQSPFTQFGDFPKWNYHGYKADFDNRNLNGKNYGVGRALRALGLSDKATEEGGKNEVAIVLHGNKNTKDASGHWIPFRKQFYDPGDGQGQRASTGAYFYIGFNTEQGVLLAMHRLGPMHVAKQMGNFPFNKVPELRQSSDIMWFGWRGLEQAAKKDFAVNYFVSLSITNPDTVSVMQRALDNRQEVLKPWPGVTFSMDTDEGKAILGTPNAVGLAYFLLQHKNLGVGNRVVTEVVVFHGDTTHGTPCLIFKIVDAPQTPPKEPAPSPQKQTPRSRLMQKNLIGKQLIRHLFIETDF